MRQFRPLLRETGMSEQQWRVLRALGRAGYLEAGALAQATCLLAPSLSRILPDMERRQLIVRRQLESDLRRSVISLDRKGVRLLSLYSPLSDRIHGDITRRFGSRRMAMLLALLRELEDAATLSLKAKARRRRRG
jgi:homoprotocatechuate degradation regulator HpaR